MQKKIPTSSTLTYVLIPAAGQGLRMGGGIRKQFRLLDGESVLCQTLRAFDRPSLVQKIIVAAPASEQAALEAEFTQTRFQTPISFVAGGQTRQESVYQALCTVPPEVSTVLVHDAVRPFISPTELAAVILAAQNLGAAALAIPLADTLRKGSHQTFGETVPRDGLYRMQTPQGFRADWFREAHEKARRQGFEATDDVALMQGAGHEVAIIEGSAFNLKLTTPADWDFATAIWPMWCKKNRSCV